MTETAEMMAQRSHVFSQSPGISMNQACQEIFREHLHRLEPIPTGEASRLQPLDNLRAILLDIYGTVVISASGDVGTDTATFHFDAFTGSLVAEGVPYAGDAEHGAKRLHACIREHHVTASTAGEPHPEVEIRKVWAEILAELAQQQQIPADFLEKLSPASALDDDSLCARLACQYEVRINPTWPMPGVAKCLQSLRERSLTLGIISNAQFYTPLMLSVLLDKPISGLGIDPVLQYYSFQMQTAKPGDAMFSQARDELDRRGIRASEVLYIGNDMLNDITPAARVGFRTALFAGDARSLRLREGDPRTNGVHPDLVLSCWPDLLSCLTESSPET